MADPGRIMTAWGIIASSGGPSPSPSWAHDGDDATGGDGDCAAPLVRESRDRFPDLRPARSLMRGCGGGAGRRRCGKRARTSGPCAGAHAVIFMLGLFAVPGDPGGAGAAGAGPAAPPASLGPPPTDGPGEARPGQGAVHPACGQGAAWMAFGSRMELMGS